ncbi:MAG TPA: phenylacetic acid degradation protein [Anaerolineae bacterium]|nr:phenylacetic acid degradation protein [Anaerolineae bacterium]HIP70373.1 phenylacetic acid degradation protein [Anaerolineae bacterium]
MSDTQWPRFELFLQDRDGRPHTNVGTVHAPDAEMALLNGRDVYVRRPNCISLWAAPSAAIYAKTAEELAEDDSWQNELPPANAPERAWYVFQKQSQRNAMIYVAHTGEVQARSAVEALQKAIAAYDDPEKPTWVWWVCPAEAITRSSKEDIDSMFLPARHKPYKHPQAYRTVTAMRKIKAE